METLNNRPMDSFYCNHHVQQLLQAHGQWVHNHIAYGWRGYLLSFMFCQIPGSERKNGEHEEASWLVLWKVGQGFSAESQPSDLESVSSKGNSSSRFSCSQAFQGSFEGCDDQRRTSLARASVGQSVRPEIVWKPGCSYQRKSEKISGWQHSKNRRGADHS